MRNFKYLFEGIFVIAAILATTLIYGTSVYRLLFLGLCAIAFLYATDKVLEKVLKVKIIHF